jgi:hypothetical protein
MSDVFYLRPMVPPIGPDDVGEMARAAGGCFNLHRVDWVQSNLAADGGRMLCWYRAPDAESVRIALRQLGSDMSAVWAAAVTEGENERNAKDSPNAEVVAEFSFDDLEDAERLRATREAIPLALEGRGLSIARTFASTDGAHFICVVRGHDDAAVKDSLVETGASPSTIWRSRAFVPSLPDP